MSVINNARAAQVGQARPRMVMASVLICLYFSYSGPEHLVAGSEKTTSPPGEDVQWKSDSKDCDTGMCNTDNNKKPMRCVLRL
jgi:hypothetical protein